MGLAARSKVAQGKTPDQPKSIPLGGLVPPRGMSQAELQRAEVLVDVLGQRLALMTSKVGLQIRRMAAYAREGTEDVWAEAQHMRFRSFQS